MDSYLDGEEMVTLAGSAHVPVGDPRIRDTGHARTCSPMHSSVFPAKAGNQEEAESVWKLGVKPFSLSHPDLAPSRGKGFRKGLRRKRDGLGDRKEEPLMWRGVISLGEPGKVKGSWVSRWRVMKGV